MFSSFHTKRLSMAVKWFYKMAGQEIGPFTSQQLKQLADEKRITPTDPVRRDTDTEWSVAGNVKGLFPEKSEIPTGVAVPVAPKAAPVVTPVEPAEAAAPVVVPVAPPKGKAVPAAPVSARPARPAHSAHSARTASSDSESGTGEFVFGFDSASSTKASSKPSASRIASKSSAGKRTALKKGQNAEVSEEGADGEKKTLSKKEIQKRNFFIIAAATVGVILLAGVILIIASCKGSSKPENDAENAGVPDAAAAESTDAGTEKGTEEKKNADADSEEGASDAEASEEEMTEEEKAISDAEKSGVPKELAEEGYKPAYVEGKIMSCTFGSLQITVKKIENCKLGDFDPKSRVKDKTREYCFVTIKVKNVSKDDKLLDVPGWGVKGTASVKLLDDKGNQFKTQRVPVENQADSTMQIGSGEEFTDILVFNPPKFKNVEFLRLNLPAISGEDASARIFVAKDFFAPNKESAAKSGNAEGGDSDGDAENPEGAEKTDEAEGTEGAKNAEKADGAGNSGNADGAADAAAGEKAGSADAGTAAGSAPVPASASEEAPKPEEGGLVDELEKTPPPPDAESKELKNSEENIDILNDPALE